MLLAYAISICRHCRRHKERGTTAGKCAEFPAAEAKPGRLGGFRRGSFGTQRPQGLPIRTCALRLPAAAHLHVRAFWPSLPLILAAALVRMGSRQRRKHPSSGHFVEPIYWAARQRNGWAPSCDVVRKKQERARTRVPAYQPIPLLGPAGST